MRRLTGIVRKGARVGRRGFERASRPAPTCCGVGLAPFIVRRAGFVVMKRPAIGGGAPMARGFER
jgi:hypothetical protein